MAKSTSIPVRRGDDVTQPLEWEAGGSPVNLTGSTLWMNIRVNYLNGVLKLTQGNGLTVEDPTTGVILVSLTEQQTGWLYPGQKSTFELKRRIGGKKTTAMVGVFDVTEAVNPND